MAKSAHSRQAVVPERIFLIGADRDAFLAAVMDPPPPTEKLAAALKRHRETKSYFNGPTSFSSRIACDR